MKIWTSKGAHRFLDELEGSGTSERDALPLFDGLPCRSRGAADDEVRVETVAEATLVFWETLVRRAATREDRPVVETCVGRSLLAVGMPGGPALLGVRITGSGRWRVALAPSGVTARRILARIPEGEGVGRAA